MGILVGIIKARSLPVIGLCSLVILIVSCAVQDKPVAIEQPLDGDSLRLVWTYEAVGPINAPPLRVGEVVIAAPVSGPLIALEVRTGALRWEYKPPGKLWERSYSSDGQRVFVGIEGGRLVALEATDGQVAWEKDLGVNVQIAPLVVDEILYVPTTFVGPGLTADPQGRANLFALSTVDGREIWSFETDNYILQTPYLHNDVLYVGGSYYDPTIEVDEGGPMRLYAFAAEDGSLRWAYESVDGFVKATYANDDVVSFIAYQDFANGIDAENGALRWRKDTGNWVPSLAGVDDVVFFGSANTVVHALDMNSGEVVWQYNIAGGTFNYLMGAPVFVSNEMYFLTQRGDIVALNALDGTLLWQKSTDIAASRAGLTVSGGWLFAGDGEGNIYAYTSLDDG